MRICLYTDTALPKMGGQEVEVDALARQFLALGHDPIVLAPHPRLPLRADDVQFPYPVVRHCRFYSTRRLVGWYRWFLCRLHRRLRFDVLHCHGIYPPAYLAALSRDALGIPIVVTSHGGDVNPANARVRNPVLQARHVMGLQAARALVAVSRFTHEGFERLCPGIDTIVDIPNGVDLAEFGDRVPRPNDLDYAIEPNKYVLFLGRLRHQKGVDILLEALAQLPSTGGVDLVVAGDGDYREELEAQCTQMELCGRVRFVGQVTGSKKVYLLQNSIAAVVPSRGWEAFGLVALESFAAGRPVIASDLPGLANNISPGRTGFIVPPENATALAQRLIQVFAEPELMRQMGRAARHRAAKFDWRVVAAQHIELYDGLLGKRNVKRSAA